MPFFEPTRPRGSTLRPKRNSFYFEDESDRRLREETDTNRLSTYLESFKEFGEDFAEGAYAGLTFNSGLTGVAPEGFAGGFGRFVSEAAVTTGLSILLTPAVAAGFRGVGMARAAGASRGLLSQGLGKTLSEFGVGSTAAAVAGTSLAPNAAISGILSSTNEDERFVQNLMLFSAMDVIGLGLFTAAGRAIKKGAGTTGDEVHQRAIDAFKGKMTAGHELTELLGVAQTEKTAGELISAAESLGYKSKSPLHKKVASITEKFKARESWFDTRTNAIDTKFNLKFYNDDSLIPNAQNEILNVIYNELKKTDGLYTKAEKDYIETFLHQNLDTTFFVDGKMLAGAKAISKRGTEFKGIKSAVENMFKEHGDFYDAGDLSKTAVENLGPTFKGDKFSKLTGIDTATGKPAIGKLTPKDFKGEGRKRILSDNAKRIKSSLDIIQNKVDVIRKRTAVGLSPYPQYTGDYERRLKDIDKFLQKEVVSWFDDATFKELDNAFFSEVDDLLNNKNLYALSDEVSDVIEFSKALKVMGKVDREASVGSAYNQAARTMETKADLNYAASGEGIGGLPEKRKESIKALRKTLKAQVKQYEKINQAIASDINRKWNKQEWERVALNKYNSIIATGGDPTDSAAGKQLAQQFRTASKAIMGPSVRNFMTDETVTWQLSKEFKEAMSTMATEDDFIKALATNPNFEREFFSVSGNRAFKKALTGYKASFGIESARRDFLAMELEDTPQNLFAKFNFLNMVTDLNPIVSAKGGSTIDTAFGHIPKAALDTPRNPMDALSDRISYESLLVNPDISFLGKKFATLGGMLEAKLNVINGLTDPADIEAAIPVKEVFDEAFGYVTQVNINRARELHNYDIINHSYTKLYTKFKMMREVDQKAFNETVAGITTLERTMSSEGVADDLIDDAIHSQYISKLTPEQRQLYDEFLELNTQHAQEFNLTVDHMHAAVETGLLPKNTPIQKRVNIRKYHSPLMYDGDWMLVHKGANGRHVRYATRDELVETARSLVGEGMKASDEVIIMPRFFSEDTAKRMMPGITDDIGSMFGGKAIEWRQYLKNFEGNGDDFQSILFNGNKQWRGTVEESTPLHFLDASYIRAVQAERHNAHAITIAGLENLRTKIKEFNKVQQGVGAFTRLQDALTTLGDDVLGKRGDIEGKLIHEWEKIISRASGKDNLVGTLLRASHMDEAPKFIPQALTRFTRFSMLGVNFKTAVVNSTTAFVNVAPYVGTAETAQAMVQIGKRKFVDGSWIPVSAEDDFLKSVGIGLDYAGFTHLDAARNSDAKWLKSQSKKALEGIEHYAMAAFQVTEDWTHAVAAVASRNRTLKSIDKLKRIAGGESGIHLDDWDNEFQRYVQRLGVKADSDSAMVSWVRHQRNQLTGNFDKAVLPEAFRSNLARPGLQFKSFWNHQLQFWFGHEAFGSGGVGLVWKHPGKFLMSMGILGSIGGVMGLPGIEAVELVGQSLYGTSPKLWVERNFSDTVAVGLPSLAGIDISSSLQFGDMLPLQSGSLSVTEFATGVGGSKLLDLKRRFFQNSNTILQGIAEGDSARLAEAWRRINPALPYAAQLLYNDYNMVLGDGDIPSPYEAGRPKVSGDEIHGVLPNLAVLSGFPTVKEKKYTRMLRAVKLMNEYDQNKRSQAYNLAFRLEKEGRRSDARDILQLNDITASQWKSWKTRATKSVGKSLNSKIMLQNREELEDNLREIEREEDIY